MPGAATWSMLLVHRSQQRKALQRGCRGLAVSGVASWLYVAPPNLPSKRIHDWKQFCNLQNAVVKGVDMEQLQINSTVLWNFEENYFGNVVARCKRFYEKPRGCLQILEARLEEQFKPVAFIQWLCCCLGLENLKQSFWSFPCQWSHVFFAAWSGHWRHDMTRRPGARAWQGPTSSWKWCQDQRICWKMPQLEGMPPGEWLHIYCKRCRCIQMSLPPEVWFLQGRCSTYWPPPGTLQPFWTCSPQPGGFPYANSILDGIWISTIFNLKSKRNSICQPSEKNIEWDKKVEWDIIMDIDFYFHKGSTPPPPLKDRLNMIEWDVNCNHGIKSATPFEHCIERDIYFIPRKGWVFPTLSNYYAPTGRPHTNTFAETHPFHILSSAVETTNQIAGFAYLVVCPETFHSVAWVDCWDGTEFAGRDSRTFRTFPCSQSCRDSANVEWFLPLPLV